METDSTMTENMKINLKGYDEKYQKLDGDWVYDFLKNKPFKGFELLGCIIRDTKVKTSRAAAQTIEMGYKHEGSGMVKTVSFNYKKILRNIEKELKYPWQHPIKKYTKEDENGEFVRFT